MSRPYTKLRASMAEYGDTQLTLAKALRCTKTHISNMMTGKTPWRLDDMYSIMSRYGIPDDQLNTIFPRDGKNE